MITTSFKLSTHCLFFMLGLSLFGFNPSAQAQQTTPTKLWNPSDTDPDYDARKRQSAGPQEPPGNTIPKSINPIALPSCFEPFNNAGANGWTALPRGDDNSIGPIALGWNFSLFGTTYNSVYINNNGNITFTSPTGEYTAYDFPINVPMIAAFWADVDTRNTTSGQVWYKIFPDRLVVTWDRVGYYSNQVDKVNTFQLTIKANTAASFTGNDVIFAYGDMQWTTGSASQGTNGFGGALANVGVNSGNNIDYIQTGRFNADGNSAPNIGNSGGIDWLDGKCITYQARNRVPAYVLTKPLRFAGGLSTLEVGTTYGIDGQLSNQGTTTLSGDVMLKVGSRGLIALATNISIPPNGSWQFNPNVHKFSPQTAQIGTNQDVQIQMRSTSGTIHSVAPTRTTKNPIKLTIRNPVASQKVPYLMVEKAIYIPGEAIRVIGVNFKPNTTIALTTLPVWAGASPINVTVGGDGYFATTLTLPATYNATSGVLRARIDAQSEAIKSFNVKQPVVRPSIQLISPRLTDATNGVYDLTKRTLSNLPIEWRDQLEVGPPSKMRSSDNSRYYRYRIGIRLSGGTIVSGLTVQDGYRKTGNSLLFSDFINVTTFANLAPPGRTSLTGRLVITDLESAEERTAESDLLTISWGEGGTIQTAFEWDQSGGVPGLLDPIKGVAADGTARMYVVVSKAFQQVGVPIERVEMILSDPLNKSTSPAILGKLMYSTEQNNYLYRDEANNTSSISARSTGTNTDGKYWFWYVAPDDFTEDGRDEENQGSRNVECRIQVYYQGNSTPEEKTIAIPIVRPPLMLVHGINSSSTKSWGSFGLSKTLFKFIHKPDMYPDKSFLDNANVLVEEDGGPGQSFGYKPSIQAAIRTMRVAGYVSNQVDYVAHSMGGSMLRTVLQNPTTADIFYGRGYRNANTVRSYGKGMVHKFIPINTPHNGAPGADLIAGFAPTLNPLGELLALVASRYVSDLKSFIELPPGKFVFSERGDFRATGAARNLQTNEQYGGVKFEYTNLRSHLIASDFSTGQPTTPPSGFDSALKNDFISFPVGTILKFFGAIIPVVAFPTPTGTEPAWVQPFIDQHGSSLRDYSYRAVGASQIPLLGTLSGYSHFVNQLFTKYGEFNGKYSDVLWNGDVIVPLRSQTAGLFCVPGSCPQNVTLQTTAKVTDSPLNHIEITDLPATSERVKFLLNKPVGSAWFDGIPANNNVQKLVTDSIPQHKTGVSRITKIIRYAPDKIRILSPTASTPLEPNVEVDIAVQVTDTVGFRGLGVFFQTELMADSIRKFAYNFSIPVSTEANGKQILMASYDLLRRDTLYVLYDTLTVQVKDTEPVVEFKATPHVLELRPNEAQTPNYLLTYNTYQSNAIDPAKLNVTISNTAVISFDSETGELIGQQKGGTIVYFEYEGLKDTVYVAIEGGGDPYPNRIITGSLPQTALCAGTAVTVPFTSTGGAFETGNQFLVQLSSRRGSRYITLPTSGTSSPLSATLPADLSVGRDYSIRVISTLPTVLGSPAPQILIIYRNPTAILSGSQSVSIGQAATLSVGLTGGSPWNLTLINGQSFSHITTSPFTFTVAPSNITTYTLSRVSNACGSGTVNGSAIVTVNGSTACSSPANLTETNQAAEYVKFNWVTVAGATGYQVRWKESTASTWNSFTTCCSGIYNTSVAYGKTYDWQVATICSNTLISAFSSTRTFTMSCPIPFDLSEVVSGTSARLYWASMGYQGAYLCYTIRWRPVGTITWSTKTECFYNTLLTNLSPGTTYEWQISTTCPGGTGSSAFTTSRMFTAGGCTTPSDVWWGFPSGTSIQLYWTFAQSNDLFEVQWRPSGSITPYSSMTVTALFGGRSLTGLTPATVYDVQVRSLCTNGQISGFSTPISVTTATACTLPTATLSGSQTITPGQSATLTVQLTGATPWSLTLSNGQSFAGITTSPFTFTVAPTTSTTYTLTRVSNACGSGGVSGSAVVTTLTCSTMYTVQNGFWDVPSTWSCNRVPLASDPVEIRHTVVLYDGYIGNARQVRYTAGGKIRYGIGAKLKLGN